VTDCLQDGLSPGSGQETREEAVRRQSRSELGAHALRQLCSKFQGTLWRSERERGSGRKPVVSCMHRNERTAMSAHVMHHHERSSSCCLPAVSYMVMLRALPRRCL